MNYWKGKQWFLFWCGISSKIEPLQLQQNNQRKMLWIYFHIPNMTNINTSANCITFYFECKGYRTKNTEWCQSNGAESL